MRLLEINDAGEIRLTNDFPDDEIPQYAILSHTWGRREQEVTFQDLINGTGQEKSGYQKIRYCGDQAKKDELQYFWIDTCCIDKTNNAELSEAINSMYRWYAEAVICYVYLEDMSVLPIGDADEQGWQEILEQGLKDCRWFTRGWTLQEMIAPGVVQFYNHAWQYIGNKKSLGSAISKATRVDVHVVEGGMHPHACSVAQRMSWASSRQTSKVEDMAYSLLGIFDVNMPLVYGEGNWAFIRLQQEIIKNSDDDSIFAWKTDNVPSTGLLALSPTGFRDMGDVVRLNRADVRSSFTFQNGATSIDIEMAPFTLDTYALVLKCGKRCGPHEKSEVHGLILYVRKLPRLGKAQTTDTRAKGVHRARADTAEYVRVHHYGQHLSQDAVALQHLFKTTILFPQLYPHPIEHDFWEDRVYGYRLSESLLSPGDDGVSQCSLDRKSIATFDPNNRTLTLPVGSWRPEVGTIDVPSILSAVRKVKLGFDLTFNIVIILADDAGMESGDSFLNRELRASMADFDPWASNTDMLKGLGDKRPDDAFGWNEYFPTPFESSLIRNVQVYGPFVSTLQAVFQAVVYHIISKMARVPRARVHALTCGA